MQLIADFSSLGIDESKVILFILLVVSVSIHEWAHAFAADKIGDPMPRKEGRVTLDPRAHIDPVGTLLLPFIMIFLSPGFAILGWGKPVRISLPNPNTRKRDNLLITLAGPLSNFSLALLTVLLFATLAQFVFLSESLLNLMLQMITVNTILFLFNLLPIPPLDGSHVLKNLSNMKKEAFLNISKYGILLILLLVNLSSFQRLMSWAIESLTYFFLHIFSQLIS
ncbi:MAG: site-2 protease family protein [Zetaproteobacteria bacterium]|nr:site-2 protease family protein [Pseudobdellovibrionaceae bacterium]